MTSSAMAIPLLVLFIGAAGLFAAWARYPIWALITVACYGGLALMAQRADRAEPPISTPAAKNRLPDRSFR